VLAERDENELHENFRLSERRAIADTIAALIPSRQGERTDLKDGELVEDSPQVIKGEKSRDVIAEQSGFAGTYEYRCIKAVCEQGVPELVAAMDNKAIAISVAAKIAPL
jgi:hypothetical protein